MKKDEDYSRNNAEHDQDRTSSKEMEVAEPKSKLANLAKIQHKIHPSKKEIKRHNRSQQTTSS
jgi:hypothetical protein